MWKGCLFEMFLWLFFLGQILTVPVPSKSMELSSILTGDELFKSIEQSLKFIVPGSLPRSQKQHKISFSKLFDQNDEYSIVFKEHLAQGNTKKGLTFNIYDDNMRIATTALVRVLLRVDSKKLFLLRDWAQENINEEMLDYAWRMVSLFRSEVNIKNYEPPFSLRPNYYVNSETIIKALQYKNSDGTWHQQQAEMNQIFVEDDVVVINSNYSGWNLLSNGCKELDYFREDLGLNAYYYGVHLKYPFWMSDNFLTVRDPERLEWYYYTHQQLLARYSLEKEHLENIYSESDCLKAYDPNLLYDNGIPFPTRTEYKAQWSDELAKIKAIDIAIRECISRGVIYMDNGTVISLTEDNYIDLLSRLIRANYERIDTVKIVKSIYGYGGNAYLANRYNPTPSVQHNPQTTLRDPMYWDLVQKLLNYYTEFAETLGPYDFSKYESENISIVDVSVSRITTYFNYYQLNLTKYLNGDDHSSKKLYAARLKRLNHLPFTLNFGIESKTNDFGVIKIYLGPECYHNECWAQYNKFFELDAMVMNFNEGITRIQWNSEVNNKFSYDHYYNMEQPSNIKYAFSAFKFPHSLTIPKGREDGLNMTLFIIALPISELSQHMYIAPDSTPLGFPFHRQAFVDEKSKASNYIFQPITVYHKKGSNDGKGYFSPHLD